MKGIALEYIFVIFVAVVVIIVTVAIMTGLISPGLIPPINNVVDVRYACIQYNETRVSSENFKVLLYGFLTSQCKYFMGELQNTVTADYLKNAVKEIDKDVNVVFLSSCSSPPIPTHTLFVCCNQTLEKDKTFNMTAKQIKDSDVLICQ